MKRGRKPTPEVERACAQCGHVFTVKPFDTKKYCSPECLSTAMRTSKTRRDCPTCGISFLPTNREQLCCSIKCANRKACPLCGSGRCGGSARICNGCRMRLTAAVDAVIADQMAKGVQRTCPVCLTSFISKRRGSSPRFPVVCGRICQIKHQQWKKKDRATPVTCRECSAEFRPAYGDKRRVFCSDECNVKWRRRTDPKTHWDRARKYGRRYEAIDRTKVFAADGWRCYLCGVETPRSLMGSMDDRAPELEHVIPLSRGGHHVLNNVRCACRKCNMAKGASVHQMEAAC